MRHFINVLITQVRSYRECEFLLLEHIFNPDLFLQTLLLFLQELFYENRYYHSHCFRCFRCDRSLADEPFTSQGDALVCSGCYCNEFSSKCAACDKIVMPGSDSKVWLYLFFPPPAPSSQTSRAQILE